MKNLKILIALMGVVVCSSVYSIENNSQGFKSLVINPKPFRDSYSMYNLYRNNEKVILHVIHRAFLPKRTSSLYDLGTGKEIFREEYDTYKPGTLKYSDVLSKMGMKKVTKVPVEYEGGKYVGEFYYKIFGKRLYRMIAGKCSSPLDSFYSIKKEDGTTIDAKAIIAVGDFVHKANSECGRMKGKDELKVNLKSMAISNLWKVNDNLYAVSLLDFPAILYIDETLSLNNKHNRLNDFFIVDYEWLKKMTKVIEEREYYKNKDAESNQKSVHLVIDQEVKNLLKN